MQLGYKTGPGRDNMQQKKVKNDWSFVCVFLVLKDLSYSILFQNELLPPSLELVLFTHVPYVCKSCTWDIGI
jgi:hypothetical protein